MLYLSKTARDVRNSLLEKYPSDNLHICYSRRFPKQEASRVPIHLHDTFMIVNLKQSGLLRFAWDLTCNEADQRADEYCASGV